MIGSSATMPLLLLLGALHGPHPYARLGSGLPGDGAVAQQVTVVFSSPSNSSPYSVTMTAADTGQTTTVALLTSGAATATNAGDLFVAAHIANPIANGFFSAVNVTGTVTLTARTPNRTITVTELVDTGAHMAVTTTVPAAAFTTYPLGRAVQLTWDTGNTTQPVASLPDTPTQGTVTLSITHAASSTYRASIGVRGPLGEMVTLVIPFAGGADATAAGAAAVVAIEANDQIYGTAAIIDGSAAAAAGSDIVVTMTLPAGWRYQDSHADVTGAGAVLTIAAGVAAVAAPMSALVYDPGNLTSTDLIGTRPTSVSGGQEVPFALSGTRVVVTEPAVAFIRGAQVHYETAAGANRGLLLVTPTATSLPLGSRPLEWQWYQRSLSTAVSGTTMALVESP